MISESTNTPAQVGTISGRMMSSGGFSKLDDEVIEDNSEVSGFLSVNVGSHSRSRLFEIF